MDFPARKYKATYDSVECVAFEVTDPNGEYITVKDADQPIRVKTGDFYVYGLVKAPKGYHTDSIAKRVPKSDGRLVLVEEIEPTPETPEPREFLEED